MKLTTEDTESTEVNVSDTTFIDGLSTFPTEVFDAVYYQFWNKTQHYLPDDDTTVLIHLDDGEVWTGFIDQGVWRYVSGERINGNVLHWMHFPQPPEDAQ